VCMYVLCSMYRNVKSCPFLLSFAHSTSFKCLTASVDFAVLVIFLCFMCCNS